MAKYCSVQDVRDFVGEENIPEWLNDDIISKWIIQASAFVNKATDTNFSHCDVVSSTPEDDNCVMVGEATMLLVSAKIVKRGGIDKLYNTGAAGSGNIKKYNLGALSVERDLGSKSSSNSESTVNLYKIIIEEADKILALFGASLDDAVWAGSMRVDAENGLDSLPRKLRLYDALMSED